MAGWLWKNLKGDTQAPVEWLLQTGFFGLDARFVYALEILFAWTTFLMMSRGQFGVSASFALGGLSFLTIPHGYKHGWFKGWSEIIISTLYTIFCCVSMWCFCGVKDPLYRHRAMAQSLVMTRAGVLMVGFRMTPAIIIMCIVGLNDLALHWYVLDKFQEGFEIFSRLPIMIVVFSLMYLVACLNQQRRWRMLYDSQLSLTAEKAAMESLLSMVCDSVFWLSEDGCRVSRSSHQFDAIMHQEMQRIDFSKMIANDRCCEFLKDGQTRGSPVALFTTPLILSPLQTVNAELFIVDRRQSQKRAVKHDNDDMGFLVGLRLCEAFAIEPPLQQWQQLQSATTIRRGRECEEGHAMEDLKQHAPCEGSEVWPDLMVGHSALELCSNATCPLEEKMELLTAAEGRQGSGNLSSVNDSTTGSKEDAARSAPTVKGTPAQVACAVHGFPAPSSRTSESGSFSSRSSFPKGILRNRARVASSNAHDGPIHSSKFMTSSSYLAQCSLSLLEDLVSSWNFKVKGCCRWHASVNYLEGMVSRLRALHECQENWQADALWQCKSCLALSGPNHPDDACWLCLEPNETNSAANSKGAWQENRLDKRKEV